MSDIKVWLVTGASRGMDAGGVNSRFTPPEPLGGGGIGATLTGGTEQCERR